MTVIDTNVILRYSHTKFDFVDSLLLARKQILNEDIFTFDKKLAARLKEI